MTKEKAFETKAAYIWHFTEFRVDADRITYLGLCKY